MRDLRWFLSLSTEQVVEIVAADKKRVCVFPINGTRRWYLLERFANRDGQVAYPSSEAEYLPDYIEQSAKRQWELCRMVFAHGIHTLLTPLFGLSLLDRGADYVSAALNLGLGRLDRDPDFRQLCREMDVRVRFYGDYRRVFPEIGYAHLIGVLDRVVAETRHHERHLLLCGLCADDPLSSIAELTVQYYREQGRAPDKHELIRLYYGEYVEPVDLFIGFDKPCVFDMPLLATGNEDLYFMVAPSPYLTEEQLRIILYDHLFARRVPEQDYIELSPQALKLAKELYDLNRQNTLGVGRQNTEGNFWYPIPQVRLPPSLAE